MAETNHYQTLDISPAASQAEIKQAYRRLVKIFHPDTNRDLKNHDRIAGINAAYEVLSDPKRREFYDNQINGWRSGGRVGVEDPDAADPETNWRDRQTRTAAAQTRHRRQRTGRDTDEHLQQWLSRVYNPITRLLSQIINPLQRQIDDLSADPFDDELLDAFMEYVEGCREALHKAQKAFRSMPNPANAAGAAAHLYYCLNQIEDALNELDRFVTSYDDHYLHSGQEMFRIAKGLRREAQAAVRHLA